MYSITVLMYLEPTELDLAANWRIWSLVMAATMIRLCDINLTTGWRVFRNLLLPGGLAGVAAGQPFIDNAVGNRTQTNMEAFYNFPISDNIQVTPL